MGSVSSSYYIPDNKDIESTRNTTQQNLKRLSECNIVIKNVSIFTTLSDDRLFDIYLILNHIYIISKFSSAAFFGCCHTFITFPCGLHHYGLEKFQEGISFKAIDIQERTKNAMLLQIFDVEIRADEFKNFVEQECKKKYSLYNSNCIHFAYDFGRKFMPSSNVFTKGFGYFCSALFGLWKQSAKHMLPSFHL